MLQDHLTHDLDGNAGSRRIRGGMPSQVMWPQFDPGYLSGVLNDDPCRSIGDWKNPVIKLNRLILHVRPQTICNLPRDEHNLSVPAAFRALDRQLVIADIIRSELQDFADSHAASCHQFQDKSVSHLYRPEDDLINCFFFDNFPVVRFAWPVDLSQHGCIARILKRGIEIGLDEIEERFEVGVSTVLGLLLSVFSDLVQK
jgi:hypothetical protein